MHGRRATAPMHDSRTDARIVNRRCHTGRRAAAPLLVASMLGCRFHARIANCRSRAVAPRHDCRAPARIVNRRSHTGSRAATLVLNCHAPVRAPLRWLDVRGQRAVPHAHAPMRDCHARALMRDFRAAADADCRADAAIPNCHVGSDRHAATPDPVLRAFRAWPEPRARV